jgi:hypothetical protein
MLKIERDFYINIQYLIEFFIQKVDQSIVNYKKFNILIYNIMLYINF